MANEQVHIVVSARTDGAVRREALMGHEYRVVPATLVRAQVLHNNLGATYLPPEDITPQWAEAVNGAPVVIGDHPQKRGVHVSARAPDVLNARGGGFLFRAKAEGGELRADVYLDEARAGDVAELSAVLEALDKGDTVEISTGFPVVVEEVSGMIGNEAYDLIIHPAGFDHLAVFGAGQVGACSVADGCGLAASERSDEVKEAGGQGGFLGRIFAPLMAKLGVLGPLPIEAGNQSDEDKRSLLRSAIASQFGDMGEDIWLEAVFSDDGDAVFEVWGEGENAGLWQVPFEMDADGATVTLGEPVKVRRETTYVPLQEGGEPTTTFNDGEVAAMKRQELLTRLQQAGMKSCTLEKLSDEELLVIHEALPKDPPEGTGAPAGGTPPEAEEASADAAGEELAGLRKVVSELTNGLKTMSETVSNLAEATRPAMEEQARERDTLVAELSANERVPYEEAELKGKSLVELQKLQAMSRGVSYMGRGGPRASNSPATPAFADPVPYFVTPESGKEN